MVKTNLNIKSKLRVIYKVNEVFKTNGFSKKYIKYKEKKERFHEEKADKKIVCSRKKRIKKFKERETKEKIERVKVKASHKKRNLKRRRE